MEVSISSTSEIIDQPAPQSVRLAWIVWALVSLGAVGVAVLIVAAPVSKLTGHPLLSSAIYEAFSYLCHQISARSFHLLGQKFGVCSRCTGLYFGFAGAALVYPLARSLKRTDTPRIIWLILAAIPIAVDFSLGYFSIWENTQLSRFSTGALLGATAVFYIVPGLIDLTAKAMQKLSRQTQTSPPSRSGF